MNIKWGLLSFKFNGRTGNDLLNQYIKLMKNVINKRILINNKMNNNKNIGNNNIIKNIKNK